MQFSKTCQRTILLLCPYDIEIGCNTIDMYSGITSCRVLDVCSFLGAKERVFHRVLNKCFFKQ